MNKKHILSIALTLCTLTIFGQSYRMEIGAMGGGSFYMGDANSTLLQETHPAYSLMARYNINRRFVCLANVGIAEISGSTRGYNDLYPNGVDLDFHRKVIDAGLHFEFNFYEYGAAEFIPGSSNISPYVFAGLGLTGYKTDADRVTANIPFGIGIKWKLPKRFNIGIECSYRLSFSDKLDYSSTSGDFQLDDPWIAKSNWNKNKDGYAILNMYISYDLFYIGSNCYK